MKTRSGLRQRIVLGLLGYTALVTLVVLTQGIIINERAERLVWESLLATELDHFVERSRQQPQYRWVDTETISLYRTNDPQPLPASLRTLPPGVHDDVIVEGIERVVLVRDLGAERLILALDISALEQGEDDMSVTAAASVVAMILLLGIVVAWGVGRLVRPLSDMALRIASLQPDRAGQRIALPDRASAELVVIGDALNDYLQRNERFVERERAFIDSASHELRTPIAVIAGATELALEQPQVSAAVRNQLSRIQRTARGVEQLISLLLVLAKDPARLAGISDRVSLNQLLPEIVEDHRHLTRDKDLEIVLCPLSECEIDAPLSIVQVAIGNLLRNAIENSDRGQIVIRLLLPATVVIEDPGHGMSPEEISAVYVYTVRGIGRDGGGIGLQLIARLCEHLGWRLSITSDTGRGTIATLNLVPSL